MVPSISATTMQLDVHSAIWWNRVASLIPACVCLLDRDRDVVRRVLLLVARLVVDLEDLAMVGWQTLVGGSAGAGRGEKGLEESFSSVQ